MEEETAEWKAKKEKKRRSALELRVTRLVKGGMDSTAIVEALTGEDEREVQEMIAYAQRG